MSILIYGSYGYTGDLIAQRASKLGHSPVLAGRNPEKLRNQEDGLEGSFETRDFELDNSEDVSEELDESGVDAVLNCAGPFVKTYEPLVEACVDTGTHYLDITGEVEVFRGIEAYDKRAEKEGVTLIPGVGFDVVPTDCLSLHLKNRLPSADSLTVAVKALSSISHGTALTVVENIGEGGLVRRSGALEKVPTAWKSREFDFGARDEDREVGITVPLGDVVTAYHSTRIPNIETYVTVPPKARYVVESTRYIGGVLGSPPVKKLLKGIVDRTVTGPDEETRQKGRSRVYAEVSDGEESVSSLLETPEPYSLTAATALEASLRAADGDLPTGYQTPASAYGADFVTEFEDVNRVDLE